MSLSSMYIILSLSCKLLLDFHLLLVYMVYVDWQKFNRLFGLLILKSSYLIHHFNLHNLSRFFYVNSYIICELWQLSFFNPCNFFSYCKKKTSCMNRSDNTSPFFLHFKGNSYKVLPLRIIFAIGSWQINIC